MRALLCTAFLLASLAGCVSEEPAPELGPVGQIDGAVLNHVLIPYANVTVELADTGATTRTTELGGFSFFDVPVGFHTVKVVLPDGGSDRQVVAVEEGEIVKLILQVVPPPSDDPHDTILSNTKIIQLAEPGQRCTECDWETQLRRGDNPARPDKVDIVIAWDGRHPVGMFETHLDIEVRDQDDRIVMGPFDADDVTLEDGLYVVRDSLLGTELPQTSTSLTMRFSFSDQNELTHPDFRMERHITLHFGDVPHEHDEDA